MFLKWTKQVPHRQDSRLLHFQFISYSAAQSFSQCRWDQVRSLQKLLQVCKESISLDHEPRTLYLSSQPTAAVPHTLCPPKLNFSFPEFTRVCSPPGFWTALCFAWRNPTHLSNLSINTISSGKTSECLKRTWSLPSLCSWILCIRSPL